MLLGNFKRGIDKVKRKSRKSFVFSDKPIFKNQAHVPHNKDKYLTRKGAALGIGIGGLYGGTVGLLVAAGLGKQGSQANVPIAIGAGLGASAVVANHVFKPFSPLYVGDRSKRQPRKRKKELYY